MGDLYLVYIAQCTLLMSCNTLYEMRLLYFSSIKLQYRLEWISSSVRELFGGGCFKYLLSRSSFMSGLIL